MRAKDRSPAARSSVRGLDPDGPGNSAVESPMQRGSRSLLRDINVSLLIELVRRSGLSSGTRSPKWAQCANGFYDRWPAA